MLNMMEFKNEFVDRCRSELTNVWPEAMEIEEKTVHKAQRGDLTGLCFTSPGSICAPTIYVEDFYDLYSDGLRMEQLSKEAVKSVLCGLDLAKSLPAPDFDIRKRPDMLRVRLIGRGANGNLLGEAPHRDVAEDLALVVYTETGEYRALITDSLMEACGLSADELFDAAFENSAMYEPAVLYDLEESICSAPGERHNYLEDAGDIGSAGKYASSRPAEGPGTASDISADQGMDQTAGAPGGPCADPVPDRPLVLSSADLYWGSSALFYPGVTAKIHALLGGDFYVLPSSVHELIIVPAGGADPEKLEEVLRSANREVVEAADMLSDDLYICESGRVRRYLSTKRLS